MERGFSGCSELEMEQDSGPQVQCSLLHTYLLPCFFFFFFFSEVGPGWVVGDRPEGKLAEIPFPLPPLPLIF